MLNININTGRGNFVKYDESLFEVYVLDYDDNYHRDENAPTTEFERDVRKIKARYRDINKYNGAVALYTEYIAYLETKYGGKELFRLKKKNGLIDDYVPPKPRLKATKELKFLKKNKIIIGSVGKYFIDDDKLDEIVEFYSKDMKVDNIQVNQVHDKVAEKILDGGSTKKYKHIKSQSFRDDFDYLDHYFRNKNYNPKNKKKNKKNKRDKLLIRDLMRSDYEKYFDDDSYMEDSDQGIALYNNLLLSSGTVKELDVYHKLNEMGWNSYKLMKKGGYGNRVSSMFKPPKKKKKKKKKYDDKYDGLLIDIMTDNGIDTDDMDSFADFQREMLNMTSANVFK